MLNPVNLIFIVVITVCSVGLVILVVKSIVEDEQGDR